MSSKPIRPVLKIRTASRSTSFGDVPTPASGTPGEPRKIKLKLPNLSQSDVSSQPVAPSMPPPSAPVVKTKSGRATKPSAKLIESRKRAHDDDLESASEDELQHLRVNLPDMPSKKRVKLVQGAAAGGSIPKIHIRQRRSEILPRIHGEAYDSAAEDMETDPVLESQIIFRMVPGPDLEYIHECLASKMVPGQPDFDFQVKWLDPEGKRALVRVRKNYYAATLVELPTITESMKTWDRKAFLKTADIVQMLLVLGPVQSEAEALTVPFPEALLPGHKWPHGLTPPMHDCLKRRFRKATSKKEKQRVEVEVDRLLALDEEYEDVEYHFERPDHEDGDDNSDMDAEGEIDESGYYDTQSKAVDSFDIAGNDVNDRDAEALAQMLLDDLDGAEAEAEAEDDISSTEKDSGTGAILGTTAGGLPDRGVNVNADVEEDEDEDEDDDEDEDEDEDDEGDANDRDDAEDCREIERQIKEKEEVLAATGNSLLKKRVKEALKSLRNELELKRASMGKRDDDGD